MKKTLTILTAFIFCLLSLVGKAQTQTGKISGTVIDENKKPVESATISVLKAADSALVKSIVSDKDGKFVINDVNYGKYIVSVSSVDHEKFFSKSIEISSSQRFINLNNISLSTESKSLKEVSVIGKKPVFEQKADRMIVNVDASPSNAGST